MSLFGRVSLSNGWVQLAHLWDCATADAQRLRLGASPPQKKFMQSCSSSVSGIMENHNTHLIPGFTPQQSCFGTSECGCSLRSMGPFVWGGGTQPLPDFSQQGNHLSPCGLKTPGLHSVPVDSLFSPEHCHVSSCRDSDSVPPLFIES